MEKFTMYKCKYANEYKAVHPPKCNDGRGCDACRLKWEGKNRARARKLERMGYIRK